MNKARFESLPADIRAAIDELSNEALVTRFGLLWNKWDQPVRDGATGPGHEVIVPDAATLASGARRCGRRPIAISTRCQRVASGMPGPPTSD